MITAVNHIIIVQGGARLTTGPRPRSRQASVAGSNENLIDDKVRR